ncbi:hypothetical protein TCAL_10869, partial [Tigriopus californicus]
GVRATKAFKVDQKGKKGPLKEISIKFVVSQDDCELEDSSSLYVYELSLAIVKLIFSEKDQSTKLNGTQVLIQVEQGPDNVIKHTVQSPRINPEATTLQSNQHLFRTWPFAKYEEYQVEKLPWINPGNKSITLSLQDIHPQDSMYFLVTLHKRVRDPYTYSQWNSGCPNSRGRLDYGCEIFVPFQVCIPHDGLTCDYLPNCAQTTIPNADENCSAVWSFQNALLLLIYTLAAISSSLIILGCVRACILRSACARSEEPATDRRPSGIMEYLSNSLPRRPRNAPPTYDDAVKNNEGFEPDERPPSYSQANSPSLLSMETANEVSPPRVSDSVRSEDPSLYPQDPPDYDEITSNSITLNRALENHYNETVPNSNP